MLAIIVICLSIISCSKGDENFLDLKEYSFNETNSQLMFQDDESMSVMFSEERRYEIAKVLRVRPIDNFTIEVADFAPVDIESELILAEINLKVNLNIAYDLIISNITTNKYTKVYNKYTR